MGGHSSRYRAFVLAVAVVLAAVLLPQSASAQPTLWVSPTSINLQGYVGANLAFVTVKIRNHGTRALKWSVSPPTASWLRISQSSGVNSGTLTVAFGTSALAAGDYRASFRVDSNGGSETVNIQVSIDASLTTSPVAPLVLSCPANMTLASSNGSAVPATYSATTSGGVSPVTVIGSPASGSAFPVGTTPVAVTAQSTDAQTARCTFSVTVTYSATTSAPPPSTSTYGPQSTISCPAGAIDIWPGVSIQTMVNTYPGTTTFCIRAGIHYVKSPIVPKTANTFVGEYGAILDGTGWTTTLNHEAAFMAHNQDIDDVTIRNLVIRKMPQRGIHAFYLSSDRWTIEYNEIQGNRSGVSLPNASILRRNYIHHNNGDSAGGGIPNGGYILSKVQGGLIEENEIAYNGAIQKIVDGTRNVIFRNNWVHHNGNGIWYDGDNTGVVIEGNLVEDNTYEGIFYEISGQGVIRNNTVRRSGDNGIFVSTSRDVEIYGNTLENNFRAINLFVSCGNVHPAGVPYTGAIGWDLRNNNVHDNFVVLGTQTGVIGNLLSYDSTCTAAQVDTYLNGSKGNVFRGNRYSVPALSSKWWYWGNSKTWTEWQALGLDTTGSASQ